MDTDKCSRFCTHFVVLILQCVSTVGFRKIYSRRIFHHVDNFPFPHITIVIIAFHPSPIPMHTRNRAQKDWYNKTREEGERRVIALDRDFKRMTTMSQLLKKSGATCVELIHQDFLTVQPGSDDAEDIKFILVDPSCSGSGMISSQSEKLDGSRDTQRLQTLKRFQISILKHALRFPNVERVVYSTCSIHEEENEQVVEEVMAQVTEYYQFHSVLPEWKYSRGLKQYPHHRSFLRLSSQQDLTQGFFVACFERMKSKQGSMMDRGKHSSAVQTTGCSKDNRTGNNNNSAVSAVTRDDHPSSTSYTILASEQDSLSLPEGQRKKKKKMKRMHSEITADSDDVGKVCTPKMKKRKHKDSSTLPSEQSTSVMSDFTYNDNHEMCPLKSAKCSDTSANILKKKKRRKGKKDKNTIQQ